MNYRQTIANKNSVRDYKEKTVDEKTAKAIRQYARACPKLVEDIETDIRFMNRDAVYQQLDGYAGYKGNFIDAPHYMILLSEKKDHYVENGGYIGEGICLQAHSLGVDSCWITFPDSKTVVHRLNLVTEKEVVALIAFGYGKKARKITTGAAKVGDNYTKVDMERKQPDVSPRMPLEEIVYMGTWGQKASVDTLMQRALYDPMDYARRAPSTLNRQPWRFVVGDSKVILTVRIDDETNEYEEAIDAGIAMLYFEGVIEQTLCSIHWDLGEIDNTYQIPDNYKIIASCDI